ncbi:MAG: hypothetical protein II814_07095, partial [Treponema sp.]|nr:hypothetical protein [Treponema sp.]
MKKVSRKIFGLLAASALFAGAFVSCSNGSDSPSALAATGTTQNGGTQNGTTTSLSDSATVKEVAQVATSVTSASYSSNTATLAASNGTYVLTGTAVQPNIAISATQAQSSGGTWKFTETNATSPKYTGSYTGDITTIGSSETSLTLKVEKVLNNGILSAVVDKQSINMTVPTSGTFDATIPAVKVSSVTSYMSSKANVQYSSASNYNIYSNNERIDLSDGKITYNAVASRKNLTNGASAGDIDDNSYKFQSGTYNIANGALTGTVNGKTLSFTIDADGNLATNEGVAFYLISGSYKIYANCVSVADGDKSYAQQKYVTFCEDTGKTGQVIDIKAFVPGQGSTIRNFKDITYEKSGNTVTLTFSDKSTKTATFSA